MSSDPRPARLLQFAKDHPLPQTAREMAWALLDVATLVVVCKEAEARNWTQMRLSMMYRREADTFPGAFLSNPSLLLDTVTEASWGKSMGGHGAGCFFSYPFYQEDTLGPALLLSAFSPRTEPSAAEPELYANALKILVEGGWAQKASMSSGEMALDDFTSGRAAPVDRASMGLTFGREQIARLEHLRRDQTALAVELALSDGAGGVGTLFSDATRERLVRLVEQRRALAQASELASALSDGAPARAKIARM